VPPPELALGTTPLPRSSVFMSVFDCHVNRAPVRGRVCSCFVRTTGESSVLFPMREISSMRALPFAALAFALGAGATLAQEAIDRKLVDAGFVMRSVDTPKQMEQARRLPQRTIVSRMRDGQRHYLYADTEYCRCVLAGNAQALQAYRDIAMPPVPLPGDTAPRGINPENLVVRDMDSDFMDLEPDHILNFRF
jgi:hypothetical protein